MKKIIIDKYEINTTKLDKKFLIISDIHYSSKKDKDVLDKVYAKIKDNFYDYILIPGDFINNARIDDEDIFLDFIANLGKIAPIIMSVGNHDTALGKGKKKTYCLNEDLFNKIKAIKHVHLLDNDSYKKDNIRFIGLTLPLDYYRYHENKNYFKRYVNNIFKSVPKTTYNILLCHSPVFFEDEKLIKEVPFLDNISLVISGHMHGGLVPRFLRKKMKGKGFVDPFHSLIPKRSYGFYHLSNDKRVVISSGVLKFPSNSYVGFFNRFYDIELVELILK